MSKKITRESFSKLIENVPNWENCLSNTQKFIIDEWYYNQKSFAQIAREKNVDRTTIQRQIKGSNQFGAGGAFKKISRYKAHLTMVEKGIVTENES